MNPTLSCARRVAPSLLRLLLGIMLAGPALLVAEPKGGAKPDRGEKVRAEGPARPNENRPAPEAKKSTPPSDQADSERTRGFDHVAAKKAEQERKELGKGSEQGQAMRAEHSRKWWKFWGNKKDKTDRLTPPAAPEAPLTPTSPPPPPAPPAP